MTLHPVIARVYHAINPNFGFPSTKNPDPVWPLDFEIVAEVTVDGDTDEQFAIDMAFEKTNTINCHWSLNPEVKAVKTDARSTAVGDIVKINGHLYRCELVGWSRIE